MNTHSSLGNAASMHLRTTSVVPLAPASIETPVLMACIACGLAGGPFPAAEAAYLQNIHNRVHHGYSTAA